MAELRRSTRTSRPSTRRLTAALFGVAVVLVAGAAASDGMADAPTGKELASRINARDEGIALAQRLRMELTDRRGQKRTRETASFRQYFGNERRSVIFFESPKRIAGTAFLTHDHPGDREDDQWLYLPAMRRVRRISAGDRGDNFLGTDFTYEDINKSGKISLNDYRFKTLGREQLDGCACFLLEAVPIDEHVARELGYGRIVVSVDPETWMTLKAEYWDSALNPLKTVWTEDIRRVQGIWTAHRIKAQNHKTGHQTVFTFREVEYSDDLPADLFEQRSLSRRP